MRTASLLGLALAAAALPAAAQTASPASPNTSAETTRSAARTLAPIIVTAWRFGAVPAGAQSLSRAEWANAPQPGEDVFRMVGRLPGVTASDLSSKFYVRGGSNDEMLVRLDGLELVEPFHVKEFEGGALSIVDMDALGGVDLLTGGATAEYGNRLTGVFDMRTATPPRSGARTAVGLSLTNARFLSQGGWGAGRGQWMVSARRGYLDLVLGRVTDTNNGVDKIVPRYGDVMGKVTYRLGASNTVSLHGLYAGDQFHARDNDLLAGTSYGNRYLWANWYASYPQGIEAHTVASAGDLDWDRGGTWDGDHAGETASDVRTLWFAGVRQDWTWAVAGPFTAKLGWDWKRMAASYDYANQRSVTTIDAAGNIRVTRDTVAISADPRGTQAGAYLSAQVRPVRALTLEAGARYDRETWTGDRTWSPRLNAAWAVGSATTLRAAWGTFYQAQAIQGLQVQDGVETFFPAERAEQRLLGIEHTAAGIDFRAEAYDRKLGSIRPRYVNLDRRLDVFPEVTDDRALLKPAEGDARGVELFAQRSGDAPFRWYASYALAQVRDRYASVGWVPRDVDQRHTLHLGAAYVPNARWRVSTAWEYHSGWPITARTFTSGTDPVTGKAWLRTGFGPLYGERLPAYQRLDARFTRSWDTRRGRGSAFLDVFNLYNHDNRRAYSYSYNVSSTGVTVNREVEKLLPIFPSIGFSWEF
jgi:outer membrane cobalamin receptor